MHEWLLLIGERLRTGKRVCAAQDMVHRGQVPALRQPAHAESRATTSEAGAARRSARAARRRRHPPTARDDAQAQGGGSGTRTVEEAQRARALEYTPKKLSKTHRLSLLNFKLETGRTQPVLRQGVQHVEAELLTRCTTCTRIRSGSSMLTARAVSYRIRQRCSPRCSDYSDANKIWGLVASM